MNCSRINLNLFEFSFNFILEPEAYFMKKNITIILLLILTVGLYSCREELYENATDDTFFYNIMAVHAQLCWRDTGMAWLVDCKMTVTAVGLVVAGMNPVRECNGLVGSVILLAAEVLGFLDGNLHNDA